MVANPNHLGKPNPPAPQPMGFRANAAINAVHQATQAAEVQRRRAEQLERRNRRLRSAAGMSWALFVTVAVTAAAIGATVGFAFGSGLLGWVAR